MTVIRDRRRILALLAGGAVVLAATILEYHSAGSVGESIKALVASALAVAVVGLALSLPGITLRGAVIGAVFVAAGIFTWTFTDRPGVIWAVLGVGGALFAIWSWPWPARLRELPRLGTAWLGLAYWLLGVVGAALVGHVGVGAQRVVYAGVFGLAAMAVVAASRPRDGRPGEDLSVGIAAAILVGLAVLLLLGSGNLFEAVHAAPSSWSAQAMRNRFWGGLGLFYHPNSMAGLAIVAAVRIGPDRAFALWQRVATTVLAGFVLFLSNSRIGLVFAGTVAVLHAVVVLRRRHADAPTYRRPWLAALMPFVVIALAVGLSTQQGFFFNSRFTPPPGGQSDITSGRIDTWRQVVTDWRHANLAEKALGDARTSRAVVVRTNDGAPPGKPHAKLNTDDAAVGALRRGGVLGVIAFFFGLVLLLRHAGIRRGVRVPPPAWFVILAIGMVPTILTEDWMLGGTNGALWILLLTGESGLASWTARGRAVEPVPAGEDVLSPAPAEASPR